MRCQLLLWAVLATSCETPDQDAEKARLEAELAEVKEELRNARASPPRSEIDDTVPTNEAPETPNTPADEKAGTAPAEGTAVPTPEDEPPSVSGQQAAESPTPTGPTTAELIAALKKLRPKKKIEVGEGTEKVTLKVTKTRRTKKWIFDRTGHQYFLRDADKGHEMYSLDIAVSSEGRDPKLPSIEAWTVEDGMARRVSTFIWKFHRWDDYGSYLGNYHDSGNDFAKTNTVKFTAGQEFTDEDFAGFLVIGIRMDGTGSFRRVFDERARPEIRYESSEYMPGGAPLLFLIDGLKPIAVLNKKKLVVPSDDG